MLEQHQAFLGQVPLILGPSSWGAGIPVGVPALPPYFVELTLQNVYAAPVADSRLGPFDSVAEAQAAAAVEATKPRNFTLTTRIVDSMGNQVFL